MGNLSVMRGSFFLIAIFLITCSSSSDRLRGHWHEIVNGKTKHCYQISDSLISVDKYTYGYSRKLVNDNLYEPMITHSTFEFLINRKAEENEIAIGDSVHWKRQQNNDEVFIEDLSIGLLVKIEPPQLRREKFDDTFSTPNPKVKRIYIGRLKDRPNEFAIEIDGMIANKDDIMIYFLSHSNSNVDEIALFDADKDTPIELIDLLIADAARAGYSRNKIFRSAVVKGEQTLGYLQIQ